MENVYTSVGCNRTYNCLAWTRTGLVYFGGNSAVVVYSPSQEKILHTLVQHSQRVNCVRVSEKDDQTHLISGSSDGSVCIWKIQDGDHFLISRFQAHSGSVTCLSVLNLGNELILATTGNDCKVQIWRIDLKTTEINPNNFFTLDLKTSLVFALHLVSWPLDNISLFYTGEDCKINLVRIGLDQGDEWSVLERLRGHEDWVTSLDTVKVEDYFLLASASQDSTIRLWRLEPAREARTEDVLEVKDVIVEYPGGHLYSVQLESILSGHEDKVFSVEWSFSPNLSLLSVSLDKTMLIWREEEGVWMDQARVGEIGGNTLGMLGATWGPDGQILGYSFNGAFHYWEPVDQGWVPGIVIGGHQGTVSDLAWDRSGGYLLSTGTDQTTRCHAQCSSGAWHEVARPQVHGYDMSCIATLPNFTFVSGAEEKVLRAFQAPQNFLDNFIRLTGQSVPGVDREKLAQGASLPTLGLSNKAVFEGEKSIPEEERHVKDQFPDYYFTPQLLDKPPPEEFLVQNTLWPEIHKMYGHGYELYSVATNQNGSMVASACKSAQPQEAAIIIWNTKTWKQIGRIEAHSLTVTQLQFNPTSSLLLSVSRDRTWSLHKLNLVQDELSIERVANSDKKTNPHKRLIWTCSWSYDGKYFFTGSRDKLVVCWGSPGWERAGEPVNLPESVTALASPSLETNPYKLAIGLENGTIHLYTWRDEFQLLQVLNQESAHHMTVTRLAFSPIDSDLLASSSEDHAVKIYKTRKS